MIGALRSLAFAGVEANTSPRQARHVVLVNLVAMVAIAASLAYIPILAWAQGLPPGYLLGVLGGGAVALAMVIVLNRWRRHDAARILLGVASAAVIFAGALPGGEAGLGHIYFLITIPAIWYVWPHERRVPPFALTALHVIGLFGLVVYFRDHAPSYPATGTRLEVMRYCHLAVAMAMCLAFAYYASREAAQADRTIELAQRRTEELLHNILPRQIADRLMAGDLIADRFDEATVLFADLANFTPRAEQVPPDQLVAMLDEIFSRFDGLCDRLGLEKIKTIGDAYMVVGGAPVPRADHADAVAQLALAMLDELRRPLATMPDGDLPPLELRIGIHTGPLVAGVIGRRKFAYDLWGDTVNLASRMESHGAPGRIQVTEAIQRVLADRYRFESRGAIDIKGKGPMPAYFLIGRRERDQHTDGTQTSSLL